MSSNAGQTPISSKAVNIPNKSSSSAFHSAPAVDSGIRRVGGSGSFGAGLASRSSSSARNNQALKSQHKRQGRPRLLDDDIDESTIMRSTTSRKGQTSITHLMNFSLPPRPEYHPLPRNTRRYNSWGLGSGYHAMDKARYVHANYRFIVTPNRVYHAQAANADVHLDWDSVLQILVSAQTQASSCPICLSTPVAPRMARCGHIFCLPCLIRFMHSTDDENPIPEKKARWKKCPICWDSIYTSETRPVRWFSGQEGVLPFEGGDVVLRLVKREPLSTLALPRDGAESLAPGEDIPWYHVAEVADYARIMKGGEDYMNSQYDLEIEDLRRQEQEDEILFGDETTWTKKAVSTINEAKQRLQGIGNPPEVSPQSSAASRPPKDPITLQQPPEEIALMYASQHTAKSGISLPSQESVIQNGVEQATQAMDNTSLATSNGTRSKQKLPATSRNSAPSNRKKGGNAPHPSDQPYFFYQALPHYYLSSLDIRILKAAFGDYSLFPATILPRVEHITTGHIVDDELRKRVKYLGHLPQGCEVNFLECDWRDTVMPDVLEQFSSELGKRRKRNKEKETREEKSRIRAEKEEDEKRWAAARQKRPSVSASDRPFSDRDFLPLASGPSAADAGNIELGSSASPPRPSSHFSALASPSTSPPGTRTVWGTAAVANSGTQPDHLETTPRDGWLEGWEDELLAQQENELIAQTAVDETASSSQSKKKGKKNKKITLMSTNIQRGA